MDNQTAAVAETGLYHGSNAASFGDGLSAAGEALGLSPEDLARRNRVRGKLARGWEDDLPEPRANRPQMMAGLLNASWIWLLTGRGDGMDGPMEATRLSPGVNAVLGGSRGVKGELLHLRDRLGHLEKRQRAVLKET